jgi:hypothetical protein
VVVTVREFFSDGHAVDIILLFMVAEFAVVRWLGRNRRRAGGTTDLLIGLAPGAFLLLAVRAALTGAGWTWVAVFLAASHPFNLADLKRRGL